MGFEDASRASKVENPSRNGEEFEIVGGDRAEAVALLLDATHSKSISNNVGGFEKSAALVSARILPGLGLFESVAAANKDKGETNGKKTTDSGDKNDINAPKSERGKSSGSEVPGTVEKGRGAKSQAADETNPVAKENDAGKKGDQHPPANAKQEEKYKAEEYRKQEELTKADILKQYGLSDNARTFAEVTPDILKPIDEPREFYPAYVARDLDKAALDLAVDLYRLAKLRSAKDGSEIDSLNKIIEGKLSNILKNNFGGLSNEELRRLGANMDKRFWLVSESSPGKFEFQYKYNDGSNKVQHITFRVEPRVNGSRLLTAESADHPTRYGKTFGEFFTGKPDQLRGRKVQVVTIPPPKKEQ